MQVESLGIPTTQLHPKVWSNSGLDAGALVMLEGRNEIEFLKRISKILHANDAAVPDLSQLERLGMLVFIPVGGGAVGEPTIMSAVRVLSRRADTILAKPRLSSRPWPTR